MLRWLYTLTLHLLLPLVVLRLLIRSLRAPAYRQRWPERYGFFAPPKSPGGIWIHAVSVGEVQAIAPLVRRLLDEHPEIPITLTTTTPTGSEQVQRLFGGELFHVYFPYDLPWALSRFFDRVNPCLLLLVETEVWPNLLAACDKRGIPTVLANGRMSERSARGYRRLGRLTAEAFASIGRVAAQSPEHAERFRQLGTPAERIEITGSIKFDKRVPASIQEQAQVIRRLWGDRPVWVAASTHEGEEDQVLQAHRWVLEQVPGALLVLVPRHPERFERVASLCRRKGFSLARRSSGEPCTGETDVFLGDTMGELLVFLGAADAAFIGGSLVKTGGHNMLEASAQGVPVCFGPHVFNFPAISRLLLETDAAVQVDDLESLGILMGGWLGNAAERSRIGENGRRVVAENRGALDRLFVLVMRSWEVRA